MSVDNSTRILVAVDVSNFDYVCTFSAVKHWKKMYPEDAMIHFKEPWETDQENLPDLTNVPSFGKVLRFTVQDRLGFLDQIIARNHQDSVDSATGVDTIFSFDGKLDDNFRKKLYPGYKAQRKLVKKSFDMSAAKRYIQNVIFGELNLEVTRGYKFVKVDGCESDDIIATVMEKCNDYMCRIILSSDRDFLQIGNVHQYNCWGEKIERTINHVVDEPMRRDDFLLWKIIRGDQSDNIGNVFHKYGDKKSYQLALDRDRLRTMLLEDNDAAERFKLNMSLIDFRKIPNSTKEKIWKVVSKKMEDRKDQTEFYLDGCMVV